MLDSLLLLLFIMAWGSQKNTNTCNQYTASLHMSLIT